MTVVTAKETGFCFGVKRAINITEKTLEQKNEKDVFILGDLIHNKQVTKELEDKGLKKISDLRERQAGTLVIRAHGLPVSEIDNAKKMGFEVVDATCPIVTKAQRAAIALEKEGYQIVIVGDRNHAEIKGIISALKTEAVAVNSIQELETANLARRVGLIFQTTQSVNICQDVFGELLKRAAEIKVINTMCSAIKKRQDEAVGLAKEVDLLIVVGDAKSANTIKMRALCKMYNSNTVQIENKDQLDPKIFQNISKIGIVAGASTPAHLIEDISNKIKMTQK